MNRRLWPCLLWLCCFTMPATTARADAVADVMAATFKITNQRSTATCFVIARPSVADAAQQERILVTAAHVFEQMAGDESRLVLREKQADGTFARKELALTVRSAGEPRWIKHPDADVAAMKLELPADASIAALHLDRLADEAAIANGKLRTGDDVWILCYPAQLEASSAGFPVLRRGSAASYPLTPISSQKTYLVDYSTFAGDSGAPVLLRDRDGDDKADDERPPLIVGLVSGQHRQTDRTVMPYEERIVHHPLGLAIVVHAEFIRQTIDRLR